VNDDQIDAVTLAVLTVLQPEINRLAIALTGQDLGRRIVYWVDERIGPAIRAALVPVLQSPKVTITDDRTTAPCVPADRQTAAEQ
jgi:hypothetical protein